MEQLNNISNLVEYNTAIINNSKIRLKQIETILIDFEKGSEEYEIWATIRRQMEEDITAYMECIELNTSALNKCTKIINMSESKIENLEQEIISLNNTIVELQEN